MPEVAGNAAMLVDPYRSRDIAEAIKILLTDQAKYDECRSRGIERSKAFSWETAARELLEVYVQVN